MVQSGSQNISSTGLITEIIIILILLAISALVSGAEVAYFSLGPQDKDNLQKNKSSSSKRILYLLKKPEDLLATILVSNNLFNIGIVILSTWLTEEFITFVDHPVLKFIFQIVLITFIILMIGDVLPKVYATRHALRLAQFMSVPMIILERLCRPVNRLLIKSTSIVKRRVKEQGPPLTVEQLSEALNLTGDELLDEEKILKGIVRFGNIEVKEIMKPRVDVAALDVQSPFTSVLQQMIDNGYSRFPVYHHDLDHLKGVLYLKDMMAHLQKNDSFRWQSLIRPAFFIPENKKIGDLLEEFRSNRMHLALVVDEYGGTSGLITLEDIMEEIVGEIRDESDEEETLFEKVNDQTFIFNGKTPLNDLTKILELPDDFFDEIKGGSDTIAGLILELSGEIPEKGKSVIYNNLNFTVTNRDDRRILEVQVSLAENQDEENQ
jgi:gliding motility-associated protein GldE